MQLGRLRSVGKAENVDVKTRTISSRWIGNRRRGKPAMGGPGNLTGKSANIVGRGTHGGQDQAVPAIDLGKLTTVIAALCGPTTFWKTPAGSFCWVTDNALPRRCARWSYSLSSFGRGNMNASALPQSEQPLSLMSKTIKTLHHRSRKGRGKRPTFPKN